MNRLLIIFVLILSSCAIESKRSQIISFSDKNVVVDYTDSRDLREATEKAKSYCSNMGKNAKYVSHEENFDEFAYGRLLAFFNCVK